MTRPFRAQTKCPDCGSWHTIETAYERWMRNSPELDSTQAGIVRFDCDVLLHKYKMYEDKKGSRDLQCLMFIEVKTHNADVSEAQRDTFSMLSQVLRNRRKNIHSDKKGRHAFEHVPPAKVWSHKERRWVSLRMFGAHLLQMSGDDPETSLSMQWDWNRKIDLQTLIRILRFELDPDSLKPMDWRRRYSSFNELDLLGLIRMRGVI